ncbi:hypothetical protein WA026_021334 [Henosepilachna vigintioctopunctata]|uniref:Uncharacterized protein n=1 Tax=Henosepilachna vigintioctopunctata TaxID=420089 RepID=A0AAW1UCI1_9CUCU
MFGLCDECKEIKIESGSNEDTIEYFQWQVTKEERIIKGEKKLVKLTKKVTVTSKVKDLKISKADDISSIVLVCRTEMIKRTSTPT